MCKVSTKMANLMLPYPVLLASIPLFCWTRGAFILLFMGSQCIDTCSLSLRGSTIPVEHVLTFDDIPACEHPGHSRPYLELGPIL
jgi:hypothetical protein